MKNRKGYRCMIYGCPKSKTRLFSPNGLRMHLAAIHNVALSKKEFNVVEYGKWVEYTNGQLQKRIEYLLKNIKRFEKVRSVQEPKPESRILGENS